MLLIAYFCFIMNIARTKKIAPQAHNDDYLDVIIISACRDKKIASRIKRLANLALKKYSHTLKLDNKLIF